MRHPYLSQDMCTTDYVRDVARHLQTGHAIGKGPVRCLQIPARPGCEAQERSCRSAPEMFFPRREVECPLSVFRRAWHIAQSLGKYGTKNGYMYRQGPKLFFVYDDHLDRWSLRSLTRISRRVQPPFGVPHAGLRGLQLAQTQ